MKELLEALKAKLGDDVITEEMLTDLQAQFDVQMNERVQEALSLKETELGEKTAEEMADFKDSLVESLDSYIEYAADEYLKENEIALEAGSKVRAAEAIIESAKEVFKHVGIVIPEESVDQYKVMEADLEESNTKLNEKIEEVFDSKKQIFEFEKAMAFMKKTSNLTESKINEVHDLMEGLEYQSIFDFEKKVDIILEKVNKVVVKEGQEEFENLDELDEKVSSIDKYLK
jgi:hypothetical protein